MIGPILEGSHLYTFVPFSPVLEWNQDWVTMPSSVYGYRLVFLSAAKLSPVLWDHLGSLMPGLLFCFLNGGIVNIVALSGSTLGPTSLPLLYHHLYSFVHSSPESWCPQSVPSLASLQRHVELCSWRHPLSGPGCHSTWRRGTLRALSACLQNERDWKPTMPLSLLGQSLYEASLGMMPNLWPSLDA